MKFVSARHFVIPGEMIPTNKVFATKTKYFAFDLHLQVMQIIFECNKGSFLNFFYFFFHYCIWNWFNCKIVHGQCQRCIYLFLYCFVFV